MKYNDENDLKIRTVIDFFTDAGFIWQTQLFRNKKS